MLSNFRFVIIEIIFFQVLANGGDAIANRAIELLKEVNTNLGPRLQTTLCDFHDTHISECVDRLRAHCDTITILCQQDNSSPITENTPLIKTQIRKESVKMCRVLKVLYEYINECDNNFTSERKLLPLYRYVNEQMLFAKKKREKKKVESLLFFVSCF